MSRETRLDVMFNDGFGNYASDSEHYLHNVKLSAIPAAALPILYCNLLKHNCSEMDTKQRVEVFDQQLLEFEKITNGGCGSCIGFRLEYSDETFKVSSYIRPHSILAEEKRTVQEYPPLHAFKHARIPFDVLAAATLNLYCQMPTVAYGIQVVNAERKDEYPFCVYSNDNDQKLRYRKDKALKLIKDALTRNKDFIIEVTDRGIQISNNRTGMYMTIAVYTHPEATNLYQINH